jgi:hypothetical protein
MTIQEAKEILAADWWKTFKPSPKPEDYEFIIGELIRETAADDPVFPDCFIINAACFDKDDLPAEDELVDWEEWAVSKTDGTCHKPIPPVIDFC